MSNTVFRALVLILLGLNLTATVALWMDRPDIAAKSLAQADDQTDTVLRARLESLAEQLQAAFNSGQGAALYSLYGPEARQKLTSDQVTDQLHKLAKTFGHIEKMRYLNYIEIGEQNGQTFLQVHFAVEVSEPGLRGAQMVLHVIDAGDGVLSLYGMRLNAGQS